MHIALFGATGGTGNQIAQQALDAGHSLSVLVRDRSKLDLAHADLTVVTGDVLNQDDVARTLSSADAVIVSLGQTPGNPTDIVSQGTANVIHAMQAQGVRRLLVITSLGVGDSRRQVPFTFKIAAATFLRGRLRDKEKQEELVRASDLDWTIIRPGGLTDGPPTGQYTVGLDKSLKAGRVARADVAAFVLQQLQDTTYLRAAPAIT